MNTVLSRVNAVSAFSLSVLAVLTVLCFLSTTFKDRSAAAQVEAVGIPEVKLAMDFEPEEKDLGVVNFNVIANFSHLFDWNTKQLFVLVVAHYQTTRNAMNQVVLWDKIIRRGETAVIELSRLRTKYLFFDDGKGLKGNQNVTLQLCWNVIPHAGKLPLLRSSTHLVQFPSSYS